MKVDEIQFLNEIPNILIMKKYIVLFIILNILYINLLHAQYTDIPDANFEQALIDLGIDTGGLDGRVLTADINSLNSLNVFYKKISSLTGIQDFVSLTSLNCGFNSLTSLDLSENKDLQTLDFSSNQIASISLVNNIRLKTLECSSNQLSNLSINVNDSLTSVNCSYNQLSSLDVNSNTLLTKLNCSSNHINSLDLVANTSLVTLNCSENQLNSLDVGANILLATFFCASNQLPLLEVGAHDSLTFFDCSNNQLKSIDVSNNLLLDNFNCLANQISNLNLSQNDSLSFLTCSNNQLKNLDVSNNLALVNLICASNQFENLDFSNNLDIEVLDLSANMISSLDISSNTSVSSLNCSRNQLSFLNINNGNNQNITKFNSIENPKLICIKVDDPVAANSNQDWQKDDIANYNTDCYAYTYVPDNNFELALSVYDDIANDNYVPTANIINLSYLHLANLGILDLTGIEDFINLDSLDCSKNQLYNLNMSFHPKLVKLKCDTNELVDLVLKNVSGGLFTQLDATGNPLLTCIQVDDVDAANGEANWFKDAIASYNLDCNGSKTFVPDDNFEQALIDLGYDNGGLDNYVVTDSINTITKLDISERNIFDLTGLEDFIALDSFDCSTNRLYTLDISGNLNLKELSCFGNYLSLLNVENNVLLSDLSCGSNKLDSLDLSQNIALSKLNCDANYLTEIDLSSNVDLQMFNCNSNYITEQGFDVSNNVNLTELFCSNNKLATIVVTSNVLLEDLDCSGNLLNQLDLSKNSELNKLDCSLNNISSLDLSEDTLLVSVNCSSNKISQLDFDRNPLLTNINCDNNDLISINISSNDTLLELSSANNKLSQIVIDNNIWLRTLNVADNDLDSLIVNANDSLRVLLCANNNLPSLYLGNNLYLGTLKCDNNLLDRLIISSNHFIKVLSCTKNSVNSLDISTALILRELIVDQNQLSELNIFNNDSLRKISCSNNQLISLDFSNNAELTSLICSSNLLSSLNGRNGNNGILATFYASNNPDLLCIEIDNEANIGESWSKDENASYTENCHYTEVYVPDDNFEAALSVIIVETSNNNDDYIPLASIEILTTLDISNNNIVDLTGLQKFEALVSLNIEGNLIDSLDVSKNSNLKSLFCANNLLDSLGLVSNTALEVLDFSSNQLTDIDLSKNIALNFLDFSFNQFTDINLSNNTALEVLDFSSNQFTEIDISPLTALTSLTCSSNELSSFDLSNNGSLATVNISSNQLTILHVNNGNNSVLTTFNATNNPDLYCIEVDDAANANSGSGAYASWQIDAIASFSENCHYNQTYVPDDAFEQALKDKGYDNSGTEPLDDYVPTPRINSLTYLSITNKGISDLTGIEDFVDLVTLNCSNNILTTIDFSGNIALSNLISVGNLLFNIDLSLNTALKKLEITDNLFTSIDLSANVNLETLLCSSNQLTSLNIINNIILKEVDCSLNHLISVDVNNGNNQNLTSFDLRNNPNLRCILVDDIDAANGYTGWYKDISAGYKIECNDDDNDGVADIEDLCLNTPYGDFVDIFGCSMFVLPTTNFSVFTVSETCRAANNGIVYITGVEKLNYTATLIGTIDTIIYDFTDNVEIRNLRADTYELCITIEEDSNYFQCYEIVITEPDDLDVQLDLNQETKRVLLKMSGGKNYEIILNNSVYNTTTSEISLSLKMGENKISVRTDADCQGIFEKTIFISEVSIVYPNPFSNYLNLYLSEYNVENVNIKIYSHLGQIVLSEKYQSKNGLIQINTADLVSGFYYISIEFETYRSTYKLIKR